MRELSPARFSFYGVCTPYPSEILPFTLKSSSLAARKRRSQGERKGVRGRPADAKRQGCSSAPVPNFFLARVCVCVSALRAYVRVREAPF